MSGVSDLGIPLAAKTHCKPGVLGSPRRPWVLLASLGAPGPPGSSWRPNALHGPPRSRWPGAAGGIMGNLVAQSWGWHPVARSWRESCVPELGGGIQWPGAGGASSGSELGGIRWPGSFGFSMIFLGPPGSPMVSLGLLGPLGPSGSPCVSVCLLGPLDPQFPQTRNGSLSFAWSCLVSPVLPCVSHGSTGFPCSSYLLGMYVSTA